MVRTKINIEHLKKKRRKNSRMCEEMWMNWTTEQQRNKLMVNRWRLMTSGFLNITISLTDRLALNMNEEFYSNVCFAFVLARMCLFGPKPKASSLFLKLYFSDLLSTCSCCANVTFFLPPCFGSSVTVTSQFSLLLPRRAPVGRWPLVPWGRPRKKT